MSGGDPTSIKARGVVPPPALSAQCAEPSQGGSIAAAEAFRRHGSDGGGSITPEPAANPIRRKRAGAGHPAALRCIAPGRCQYPVSPVGSSQPAPRARRGCAFFDAERQDFWRAVATGDIRLSPTEDKIVWDLRAAHRRWDFIARHILARRAQLATKITHAQAHRASKHYRSAARGGA